MGTYSDQASEVFDKIIQQICKPGSVSPKGCLSFIYACRRRQAQATYPPASGEQPYMRRYTWSYNSQGVRLRTLLPKPVSSYLTFSPLPPEEGGYFLLPYSTLTGSFPLRSTMLCVARTLLFLSEDSQRQTDLLY